MARRLVACLAVIALVAGTAGCPRGSEALVPKTRKGWGVAFIIVGGAWIVTGGVVAADRESNNTPAERAGLGLAFGGIGVGLIALGWLIGGFGHKAAAPTQPSPTAGPPPPPPPPPPA